MLDQIDLRRRAVFLGAGGALGAGLLAPIASASPAGKGEIPLASTYVAGAAYFDASSCCAQLAVGQELVLRRAPENDYDPRTVEVWTRAGDKLGHVPGIHASSLSRLMDAGFPVYAKVRSLRVGNRPEVGIDITMVT